MIKFNRFEFFFTKSSADAYLCNFLLFDYDVPRCRTIAIQIAVYCISSILLDRVVFGDFLLLLMRPQVLK